ncbi:MAG: excinuclease ABC subunit UvrC [Alphaproteobacteria bacterium]
MSMSPSSAAENGRELILGNLRTLPTTPGVYRMLNGEGDALYVGKARNLRRRVTSYTQLGKLPNRLQRMVTETRALEVVTTRTEVEALLLEINLIKTLRPRYNVLLRDDKSFPYIFIPDPVAAADGAPERFPRVTKYRGARNKPGDYYGPFASAGAVNRTLNALQRVFLLRSCSDNIFVNRSRPCLLFQIKRCSAPCVGRIEAAAYDVLVAESRAFLSGKSQDVQGRLAQAMQQASAAMEFETAAAYRDRIRALTQIQAHQDINIENVGEADVIAAHQAGGQTCIQVFFFRSGSNYGNRAYFPRHDKDDPLDLVLAAFVGQFYETVPPPGLVLLSHEPQECALLAEALSLRAERRIRLEVPKRGPKHNAIAHALQNAEAALGRRLAESSSQRRLLEGLAEALDLDAAPERIEVYDNSHIQGTNPYGAMIVAGPDGFIKGGYRKFAIRNVAEKGRASLPGDVKAGQIVAGDDFAMMRQVIERRFARAMKEDPDRSRGTWPDLLLIDGGKGQLNATIEALGELGVEDVAVAGVAKGPDRNAGREQIFLPGRDRPVILPERDPVLYFIQRLRDEAHRFAIGTHRAKRSAQISKSALDQIPGIGARRKKALLLHFGSVRTIERAGVEDLEKAPGISRTVAQKVYDHFHEAP